jgi:hypothetical protein
VGDAKPEAVVDQGNGDVEAATKAEEDGLFLPVVAVGGELGGVDKREAEESEAGEREGRDKVPRGARGGLKDAEEIGGRGESAGLRVPCAGVDRETGLASWVAHCALLRGARPLPPC